MSTRIAIRSTLSYFSHRECVHECDNEAIMTETMNVSAQSEPLVLSYMDRAGRIAINRLAEGFGMSKTQLAQTAGLARETLYRAERSHGPRTQERLREMLEIISRVSEWAGGKEQAMAWYRAQPLPAFVSTSQKLPLCRTSTARVSLEWPRIPFSSIPDSTPTTLRPRLSLKCTDTTLSPRLCSRRQLTGSTSSASSMCTDSIEPGAGVPCTTPLAGTGTAMEAPLSGPRAMDTMPSSASMAMPHLST